MSGESSMSAAPGTPLLRADGDELSLCFAADATVHSRVRPGDPTRLLLEYTRLMMGFLLFRPVPARIAMIGLGGGALAGYCARKLPDAAFTAVEISPDVVALRDAFGVPPDGPRFRVVCADGADFVRRDGEAPDVLLVDAFDCRGEQPESLGTPAFYDACRARLAPGGVLVVNLHAGDVACDGHVERIRASFAGRVVVVGADGSDNRVVFAGTDAAFPPPFATLVARLRALGAAHPVGLDVTARKISEARPPARAGPSRSRRPRRPAV